MILKDKKLDILNLKTIIIFISVNADINLVFNLNKSINLFNYKE